MEISGVYEIEAPIDAVWAALNNPDVLRQCIAGCEELTKESDTEFSAKVTMKVGPIKARFKGKVTLSDIKAPFGYKITGEGQGGVAGFAKGGSIVSLNDNGNGTTLKYDATAEVGGKLASIGSRLIKGVAKKTADAFFSEFCVVVERG